jgi:hypothetical protein
MLIVVDQFLADAVIHLLLADHEHRRRVSVCDALLVEVCFRSDDDFDVDDFSLWLALQLRLFAAGAERQRGGDYYCNR